LLQQLAHWVVRQFRHDTFWDTLSYRKVSVMPICGIMPLLNLEVSPLVARILLPGSNMILLTVVVVLLMNLETKPF
jgi:hypothetical protein